MNTQSPLSNLLELTMKNGLSPSENIKLLKIAIKEYQHFQYEEKKYAEEQRFNDVVLGE